MSYSQESLGAEEEQLDPISHASAATLVSEQVKVAPTTDVIPPIHFVEQYALEDSQTNGHDLDVAISAVESAVELMSDSHPRLAQCLQQLGSLLCQRYEHSPTPSDNDRAVFALQKCITLSSNGGASLDILQMLGQALMDRFERLRQLDDVERAISVYGDATHLAPERHAKKPLFLGNLGTSLLCRFERFREPVDINEAISAYKDAVRLTPKNHAKMPDRLANLGHAFFCRFEHFKNLIDIEMAISVQGEAVRLMPDSHTNKLGFLDDLATSHHFRFRRLRDVVDVDKGILCRQEALRLTRAGHTDKPRYLNDLGTFFRYRFELLRDLGDINNAISAHEEAVDLTPESHVDKPGLLNNVGNSFLRRFEHLKNFSDIDKAISVYKYAISLTAEDHPNKPSFLTNLGNAFMRRFQQSGDMIDITKSISTLQDAVRFTPEGHAMRPARLGHLGDAFSARFRCSDNIADIDEAVSAHEDAALLTSDGDVDKPSRLDNLGISFLFRFIHSGVDIYLGQAVKAHEDAVRLTPKGDINEPRHLKNLGISLQRRFQRYKSLADIDKAIEVYKNALYLIPDGHKDKSCYLSSLGDTFMDRFDLLENGADIDKAISAQEDAALLAPSSHINISDNLGISYELRFRHYGNLVDIDKAITIHGNAVHRTPDSDPSKPRYFNNLGSAFCLRFEHLKDSADLNKSISAHEDSVRLTPGGHENKPSRLDSLGNSFLRRFEHFSNRTDIDQAISTHQEAVRMTPKDHGSKPRFLCNLGMSFLARFVRYREITDVNDAISNAEAALHLIPESHAEKPHCLDNLGNSFRCRFGSSGNINDIDKAILFHETAIKLTPEGHASRAARHANFAHALRRRFEHIENIADYDRAIEQFQLSASCPTGPPLIRYNATLQWARLASAKNSVVSLNGYAAALNLLPRVVWLGESISARYEVLQSIKGLATEAAAAAVGSGQFKTALEWLEQGRSVVWGQMLNLRTPVDDLRDVDLDLADNLVRISKTLESAGSIGGDYIDYTSSGGDYTSSDREVSAEQAAQHVRRLAEAWDSLVERARTITGFEDFLRPKGLETLSKAARYGPVVTVNVHQSRCDALILVPDHGDVIHLPLESFSHKGALELQRSLHTYLLGAGIRGREMRKGHRVPDTTCNFDEILFSLWKCVVKPVLDQLKIGVSDNPSPPRIWWCPTGPLTFLPIHAAGLYGADKPGSKILDYVTSSYTPTLTALLKPSQASRAPFQGLLGVSQPCTPGQRPLPNAEKELANIELLSSSLDIHTLPGQLATTESVVKRMEKCSWVHLACHAVQDASKPLQSAFILHNGKLTLSKIIANSFPNADFAFLSACETATGDEHLSEEAVHLAAGMLAAGYRSVIATMWSIRDEDAPFIASEVYRHLVVGSSPDSSRAAHALHRAVKYIYDKQEISGKMSFLSWVPFIHVGM